jgi:hypothetical protein
MFYTRRYMSAKGVCTHGDTRHHFCKANDCDQKDKDVYHTRSCCAGSEPRCGDFAASLGTIRRSEFMETARCCCAPRPCSLEPGGAGRIKCVQRSARSRRKIRVQDTSGQVLHEVTQFLTSHVTIIFKIRNCISARGAGIINLISILPPYRFSVAPSFFSRRQPGVFASAQFFEGAFCHFRCYFCTLQFFLKEQSACVGIGGRYVQSVNSRRCHCLGTHQLPSWVQHGVAHSSCQVSTEPLIHP